MISRTTHRSAMFSRILKETLEGMGLDHDRKRLCQRVGITQSALSQYLNGQARPRLDTLVRLADFLGVSLDYLVFGSQPRSSRAPDYGPLARYIDLALANLQDRVSMHSDLVARVGHALSQQIDRMVREQNREAYPVAGLLSHDEAMQLEELSTRIYVIATTLQYDIIQTNEGAAAGRFLPIVLRNLARGKEYRWLLPGVAEPWEPVVASYRALLQGEDATDGSGLSRCKFRCVRVHAITGCALYQLNIAELQARAPVLLERVRHSISPDHWIGYLIPPTLDLGADILMDVTHLKAARKSFDALWRHGRPI